MTTRGFAPSLGPDGKPVPLDAPTPISTDFVRFARTQVTVKGTQSDDHANNAASATGLPADNGDKPGRIDYAGDVDFFRVDTGGSPLAVRVADLALGMDPRLRVYAADGVTLRAEATLATNGSGRGYLSLALDTGDNTGENAAYYLAVSQVGDQTAGGTYNLSAGPRIEGDAGSAGSSLYLPAVIRAIDAIPLTNGNFEGGPSAGWASYSSGGYPIIVDGDTLRFAPHSGDWAAWLGGAPDETAIIEQQVTILPGQPILSFYYVVGSKEDTCGNDQGAVLINGGVVAAIDLCARAMADEWRSRQVDLSAYAGQTVKLGFRAMLNADKNSNLFIDTVSLGGSLLTGDEQGNRHGPLPNLWILKP